MNAKDSLVSGTILLQSLDRSQVPCVMNRIQEHTQTEIGPLAVCKKRRVTKKALQECSLVNDKWEKMDQNILREIFSRIPVLDLFMNVSSVCHSWEAACWDFLFWSRDVLDLSARDVDFGHVNLSTLKELLHSSNRAPGFFGVLKSPEKYNKMATNLMRKLRRIMEGESIYGPSLQDWRLSIQTLVLPYDLEISDAHLIYIAERTPALQHLLFLCRSKITVNGFIKAIQNWKHLKEIHLGAFKRDDRIEQFIIEIGRNCKETESLHIYEGCFEVDVLSTNVIGESLPGLKKLEFEAGFILPEGLVNLFAKCRQLEGVLFNECGFAGPDGDLAFGSICNFWLFWTVDDEGLCIQWDVKPCTEDFNRALYVQSMFEEWMYVPSRSRRRQ